MRISASAATAYGLVLLKIQPDHLQIMTVNKSLQSRAYEKLKESRLYQTYRVAFQQGTGLSVYLVPSDDEDAMADEVAPNPLCALLNQKMGAEVCRCFHRRLVDEAAVCGKTLTCFVGFKETAIPVRSGQLTIGFLRTGQVFSEGDRQKAFQAVEHQLPGEWTAEERAMLEEAFRCSPQVAQERYLGCVTMLTIFAAQLSEELNRILIAEENAEPPMVTAAKQFVNAHLEEKIVLDEVAKYVHVSPYYFCKMFKQSTGMTLTEYVNRRRVERAKRRLLNPQTRVTEVAYDVGYQSLSQFNRSFLKYAGKSPTQFRAESQLDEALFAA